jgi:serine/threonine protein kinase
MSTTQQSQLPLSLWAGRPLWDGYRLRHPLGRGSFGQVWEADDDCGGRLALKFVACGGDLAAAREVKNILAIQALSHPGLVRVGRVWSDRGYVVLTMDLADGSLADLAAVAQADFGAPLPANVLLDFLAQAAAALDFLNARQHLVRGVRVGFQHGDVKPGNLLVFGEQVKLADFGLAAPVVGEGGYHRRAGTSAYAAPEVFRGRLSPRTDQYSLAVTYCQLRGGRVPFGDRTTGSTRFRLAETRSAPDLSMLPRAERPVLERVLAAVPQDRWPSCSEFVSRLRERVAQVPGASR